MTTSDELRDIAQWIPSHLAAKVLQIADELEAAPVAPALVPGDVEKNAARYLWLRNEPPLSLSVRRFPGETPRGCYLDGYNLDAAIDAAMSIK